MLSILLNVSYWLHIWNPFFKGRLAFGTAPSSSFIGLGGCFALPSTLFAAGCAGGHYLWFALCRVMAFLMTYDILCLTIGVRVHLRCMLIVLAGNGLPGHESTAVCIGHLSSSSTGRWSRLEAWSTEVISFHAGDHQLNTCHTAMLSFCAIELRSISLNAFKHLSLFF